MPETVHAYTAAQVAAAEAPLLAAGAPLMERASVAHARVCAQTMSSDAARVLVLAGRGNNGGDALFAAAHLLDKALRAVDDGDALTSASADLIVDVLLVAEHGHEEGLAAVSASGARFVDAAEAEQARYDLIIDGVLGIGTRGDPALRGIVRDVVAALLPAVERGDTRVVAVDLPSGLHPDEGTTVDDRVLPATVTVTFGGLKAGLVRGRGPELAGRIVLVQLGLEPALAVEEPVVDATVDEVVVG